MPRISLRTAINAPIQRCFDLSRSVEAHQWSTQQTGERVIAGKQEGLLEKGDQVTWRAKHFGIWQNLTAQITAMNSPYFFCDEMIKGAFKSFRHEHHFEEIEEGTLMKDQFTFETPFGIIGKVFNRLVLTNYMEIFLVERNKTIKELAEGEEWTKLI